MGMAGPAAVPGSREVRVLSKFRHPNLVLLLGFAAQDNERSLRFSAGKGTVLKCHQAVLDFLYEGETREGGKG